MNPGTVIDMSEPTTTEATPFSSNKNPTVTVTLELFGETRTVAMFVWRAGDERAHVYGQLVATQNGYAAKARYNEPLTMWRVTEAKPAYKGNKVATASDGSVWQFHLGTVVRNRQARFVGWADVVGATNHESNERR